VFTVEPKYEHEDAGFIFSEHLSALRPHSVHDRPLRTIATSVIAAVRCICDLRVSRSASSAVDGLRKGVIRRAEHANEQLRRHRRAGAPACRRSSLPVSGQVRPARRARQMQSLAAVAFIPRLASISRFDMLAADSLSTSRISRMGNLISVQACPAPCGKERSHADSRITQRRPPSPPSTDWSRSPKTVGRDQSERLVAASTTSEPGFAALFAAADLLPCRCRPGAM
jgi:hypothetical protein